MEQNKLLVVLTITNVVVYVVAMVFNGLSTGSAGVELGVFRSSTGDVSDVYYLEITPAGWMFSIWGIIYLWLGACNIYTIVNLFRKTNEGRLYCNPVLLPASFFISLILNIFLNLSWLFLFDREQIEICFPVLFLTSFTLYVCLFISYRYLDNNLEFLTKFGRQKDIWLIRIVVQNGLSVYATWTSIATLLNMAMVMIYRSDPGVSNENACTVALGFLVFELLLYAVSDMIFLDRYTRYTITPYVVVPVALGASLAKNYSAGARNTIFTLALLGLAVLVLLTKIVVLIWRVRTKPTKATPVIQSKYTKREDIGI